MEMPHRQFTEGNKMSDAHIKHTHTIKLQDGSTFDHTAEAVRFKHLADGAIAVFATCCGKDAEGSWHAFYDVAKMSQNDITVEVQGHVQRKAEHHASAHLGREFMQTLVKEGQVGK
jgi:hypothetical protein